MGAELLLLGGQVSAAAAASSSLTASSVSNGRRVVVANLNRRAQLRSTKLAALCQRGSAWQWRHTADKKPQDQRCCATPKLWTPTPEDGKMGFTKEIVIAGTGPKPVKGQKVTVHCTGYGKDGDLSQKFWSTKDPGQEPFEFKIGLGSVIKGWDEGVMTMQVGEVARIKVSPDYGYGANGFPSWGIQPHSELVFEIEVLNAK